MSNSDLRPSKRRKTSSPDTERATRLSTRSLSNLKSKDSPIANGASAHKHQRNGTRAATSNNKSSRHNVSDSVTTRSIKKELPVRRNLESADHETELASPPPATVARHSSRKRHLKDETRQNHASNGKVDQATPTQKKPNWRGWVKLKEGEQVHNDHDEWDRIKREAEEAAQNDSPSKQGRQSRRTRISEGHHNTTPPISKPKKVGKATSEPRKQVVQEQESSEEPESERRKSSEVTKPSVSSVSSRTKSWESPSSNGINKRKRTDLRITTQIEQPRRRTPVKDKGNVTIDDLLDFDRNDREPSTVGRTDSVERRPSEQAFTVPDSQEVRQALPINGHHHAYHQHLRQQYGPPRSRRPPSPVPRMPVHESISPTPDEEVEDLDDNASHLRQLLSKQPLLLDAIKDQILNRLTTQGRLDDHSEYDKVHQLLSQTVLAGEGNSMVIVGSRGSGKTALVNTALSSLAQEHRHDFHVVRLNGFIHTDDKIALKEIWRQLGREMDVEDELMTGRSNYADILTSLLALLSHHGTGDEGTLPDAQEVSKSVIFVLDEFHLFASHLRQTLLYNLFDLAQSSRTPLAVIGLTTRTDVTDLLEKRVKSRFGQRIVQLTPPRTFESYKHICQHILQVRATDAKFSDRLLRIVKPESLLEIADAWNANISSIFAQTQFIQHLEIIHAISRVPISFFNSALIPVASLSVESPLITVKSLMLSSSSLRPPENDLDAILPSLSTLQLSLLISAARLEVVLAPSGAVAIGPPPGTTFDVIYEEYVDFSSKTKVSASAAGQVGVGGAVAKVWGRKVAKKEWEGLADVNAVVPVGLGGTRGILDQKWVVEIGGLEELRNWLESQHGRDVDRGLIKWCKI